MNSESAARNEIGGGDVIDDTINSGDKADPGVLTLLAQPVNQIVNEGVDVTLSVVAAGSGTLTFQWYFDGGLLKGANSAQLTLASVTTEQAGRYHVVVSNGSLSTQSNAATVNVAANTLSQAHITWDRPTQREDSSGLREDDIAAYEIYHANSLTSAMQQIDTVDASLLAYTASGLEQGTHYFSLATVDSLGVKSALSTPVSIRFD